MFNPSEVDLLIFDLDGTIAQSDKAVFIIWQKIFSDIGEKRMVNIEEIRNHLGEPCETFFRNLLGPENAERWEEFSKKYDPMIPEYISSFPDVSKVLRELKERNYKLALCSNCGKEYLHKTILKLNIAIYFDYIECNGDNNLSKKEIIKKIINKFPGLKGAVIGDKMQDIEAARENNCLSVGALYGYGKDEPKQADITINKFSDLLNIFDI